MNIKEFIEKAIEGGWRATIVTNGIKMTSGNWEAIMMQAGSFSGVWLLDPLAWQAVGKVEGWGKYLCEHCGQDFDPQETREELHDVCMQANRCRGIWQEDFRPKMHRFIDSLCDGKSLETALSEATSN